MLTYDSGADRSTLQLDVDGGAADFTLTIDGEVGAGSGWVL